MKNLTSTFVIILGTTLAFAVACGGDDSADTGGSSGGKAGSTSSGGKGGTTSDGGTTNGSGGDSTGTAGENGSGQAGAAMGGSSAGGASAGGAGGAFENPEACPTDAPTDGETGCTIEGDHRTACEYAGSTCWCLGYTGAGGAGGSGGADSGGTWECLGAGTACPTETPTNTETCEDEGAVCPYPGDQTCQCVEGEWSCTLQGPGCDTEKPQDGSACEGPIWCPQHKCTCPDSGEDANTWVCL